MAKKFLLYISAATDMEMEREIAARSVIAIPADVTWRIEQSPRKNEPVDRRAIAQADGHLLLLGGDIRAPVGLEWMTARHFGLRPLPLLKQGVNRTPAAEDFRRYIADQVGWQAFAKVTELQRTIQLWLGRQILDQAALYGLSPDEVVHLQRWLSIAETEPVRPDETFGGAGDSSLIFSKDHYEPSTGRLLPADNGSDGPDA